MSRVKESALSSLAFAWFAFTLFRGIHFKHKWICFDFHLKHTITTNLFRIDRQFNEFLFCSWFGRFRMKSKSWRSWSEKNMHDSEFTCALFRFIQLLCEGHNVEFQNYLRTQAGNTTTVNLVIATVDYLLRLQESIMDFY
jgi:hypothetical protein